MPGKTLADAVGKINDALGNFADALGIIADAVGNRFPYPEMYKRRAFAGKDTGCRSSPEVFRSG